jgi:putative transposase
VEYKDNVYSCKYHVVWCSKYRRSVLAGAVEKRLKSILRDTARDKRATVIEVEVMPDYVHLLIEVYPQYDIHVWCGS